MKFLSCLLLCVFLAMPVSAASNLPQPTGANNPTVIVWEVGTLLRHFLSLKVEAPKLQEGGQVPASSTNHKH